VLALQSTQLDDGLVEYMTLVRGVVVVTAHMCLRGLRPLILLPIPASPPPTVAEATPEPVPPDWAAMAIVSLESLQAPCARDPVLVEYHAGLLSLARQLLQSRSDGKSTTTLYPPPPFFLRGISRVGGVFS